MYIRIRDGEVIDNDFAEAKIKRHWLAARCCTKVSLDGKKTWYFDPYGNEVTKEDYKKIIWQEIRNGNF